MFRPEINPVDDEIVPKLFVDSGTTWVLLDVLLPAEPVAEETDDML